MIVTLKEIGYRRKHSTIQQSNSEGLTSLNKNKYSRAVFLQLEASKTFDNMAS